MLFMRTVIRKVPNYILMIVIKQYKSVGELHIKEFKITHLIVRINDWVMHYVSLKSLLILVPSNSHPV